MEPSFMNQVDIPSLLRDILRQWWTILLCAISVAMLTYVYVSVTYVPSYTTSATFAVTSKSTGSIYSNLTSASETATRFSQVLESNLLRKTVMEDLDMDSWNATTSASQVTETNMVELSVTSRSAVDAYRILNSILKNHAQVTDYVVGSVILEMIREPSMPLTPTNSKNPGGLMKRNALLAMLCLILLVGWSSYRRDTIKNLAQFKDKVDAPSLGVIYHERKSDHKHVSRIGWFMAGIADAFSGKKKANQNVAMLINNPMRSFFFVESNKMVASRVRSKMDAANAQVALVTSVMENEGKSTVAANIALGMAQEGKKVLLVDMDFRKPSQFKIFQLDADMKVNLVRYMNDTTLSEAPARQYKDTSLYLIANFKRAKASDADVQLTDLRMIIDFYRDQMDYIILDSSPMALVTDTEALAALADTSILVVREDTVLATHINDAIDVLNRVGAEVLGCVFSDASGSMLGLANNSYGGYGGYYGSRK